MEFDSDSLVRLFAREVPEIAEGTILIRAIARMPGCGCKLALQSMNPQVDCIGVCVGTRGARIKRILEELDGERIDLVLWYDRPEELIVSALMPARIDIDQVVLHPADHRAVVRVLPQQVLFVRENRLLATELSGWLIEIEEL